MTKIDVFSGFIGAGKTTLINRIVREAIKHETIAIVENEFGDIGIDGTILEESGINIKEISGGCICCTLFGNFVNSIVRLVTEYRPERIIVEPTGLGKLSDVINALKAVAKIEDIELNILATVVDPMRFDFYKMAFGDFFFDQINETNTIILSRTQLTEKDELKKVENELHGLNCNATIIAEDWDSLTDARLLALLEDEQYSGDIVSEISHHLSCSPEDPCHNGDCHEHHEHHHDHKSEIVSYSALYETKISVDDFMKKIEALKDSDRYGLIIRGKGFFVTPEDKSYRFDYVHEELNLYEQSIPRTGKIVFIGKCLDVETVKQVWS